jgi:16S rRNA (guanine966-N2)-methyltransferase
MATRRSEQKGILRIVGGQWRGRKLLFSAAEGLRPTADRIRETLFNWLASELHGAHCLDLFSGSGALGLEALSRGAASCLMVEKTRQACTEIGAHMTTLNAQRGECLQTDALALLQRGPGQRAAMDIVFLDPPFGHNLLEPAGSLLEQKEWLADTAKIYVESSRREPPPELPENWRIYRDKTAGEVRYQLFVRTP